MRKYLLLPVMVLLILSACEKEKGGEEPIYDLYIVEKEYQRAIGETIPIFVHTGNRDYTVTPADPDMVTCQVEPQGESMGRINVTLLKKGTTTIEVKDNVVDQTETLTIHITDKCVVMEVYYEQLHVKLETGDPDEALRIAEEIKQKFNLNRIQTFVLIDNERQTFYELPVSEEDKSRYKNFGFYTFEEEGDRRFLVFDIQVECGATPKEIFEFDMSEEYPGFALLERYLSVEWQTKDIDPTPPYLHLKKDVTRQYKEEYPELEYACWDIYAYVYTGGRIPLEWFEY